MEYSVPMILGSFFLDVAMIRHKGTMFNDQICVSRRSKQTHPKSDSFVLSAYKF